VSRCFRDLYRAEAYPAMSHPTADPAVCARVARRAGLRIGDVSRGRLLDLGCGSGHHILSLANRWPEAECVGVDVSAKLVARGRNLARMAGLGNVRFCECSILDFEPEGEFDVIVAHGVFSWVDDEVKLRLMDFIGKRLSTNGISVVSFNVAAGWKARMAVVEKVRAIQAAGNADEMKALQVMMLVAEGAEKGIVDDMLAKGAEVLAFDDFAPVMDAWSLGAFLKLAGASGLRWLGNSVGGKMGSDEEDERMGRTFRTELFCRADADLGEGVFEEERVKDEVVVPMFPKLDAWRMVCAREGLAVPDEALKPCVFPFSQLKVLVEMDGKKSVGELLEHAKKVAPELDFAGWLRYLAGRGIVM
jgi:SAM-dependent methyltransferase